MVLFTNLHRGKTENQACFLTKRAFVDFCGLNGHAGLRSKKSLSGNANTLRRLSGGQGGVIPAFHGAA